MPDGRVKAVHTVEVEWKKDGQGRFSPQPVAGTEKVVPAHLVLLAMGFLGPEQPLLDELGLERDARTQRQGRLRQISPPTSQASLPPATAAAARASWSGPSTKAAAPPASATAS